MKSSPWVPMFCNVLVFGFGMIGFVAAVEAASQEPVSWKDPLEFHTFSIAAEASLMRRLAVANEQPQSIATVAKRSP